jgi:hypothetical protein
LDNAIDTFVVATALEVAVSSSLFAMLRLATLTAGLELVLLGCGGACHDIGCIAGETMELWLPPSTEMASQPQVTACRNTDCWRGFIEGFDSDWSLIYARIFSLDPVGDAGETNVRAEGSLSRDGDRFYVKVLWAMPTNEVREGDSLSMVVLDAASVELASRSATTGPPSGIYLNGAQCDSDPCRNAYVSRE